jgi:hypothetical protein
MTTHASAFLAALLALGATAASACPDTGLRATFGAIRLDAGFMPDPYVRNITAGGTWDLASCFNSYGWGGVVPAAPDFELTFLGSSPQLTLEVQASTDAVLLVNDPNGEWFYIDDTFGTNPAMTFPNPVPGVYDIWIGAYDITQRNPGQLLITER